MSTTAPVRMRWVGILAGAALIVGGPGTTALATPADADSDLGAASEIGAVETPDLTWSDCPDVGQCASAVVPMDYDEPEGETVTLALRKIPARVPAQRLGTLFLNPGGPGGSGKDIARRATELLSDDVLDRYDIVGMDPRGTNESTPLSCYDDPDARDADNAVLGTVMPASDEEREQFEVASSRLARECADEPLAAAMSTANVARDMELMRRAVGDDDLNYLGWSYGTYLGQTYADMFPEHVGAMVLDGVVDAEDWQGRRDGAVVPATLRTGGAAGSSQAFADILDACADAGADRCGVADPHRVADHVFTELEREPLVLTEGDQTQVVTLGAFLHQVRLAMHDPEGAAQVPAMLAEAEQLLAAREEAPSAAADAAAVPLSEEMTVANHFEVNAAVLCADGQNPMSLSAWRLLGRPADRMYPHFGKYWLWQSSVCAEQSWTVTDEDAHRGSFDAPTAQPILVVGSTHDPATPHDDAAAVAERTPGARLLTSETWGHTAYGYSECATTAIDDYLLTGNLPDAGTVCPNESPLY